MYELSYLISGAVAEANIEKVAQTVEKEIKEIKGEIINKVAPIKRKLSYPINKQNFAYFVTLYFEAPKNDFKEINQFFRLNENILRHLLVESTESAMKDYLRRQKPENAPEKIKKEEVVEPVVEEIKEASIEEALQEKAEEIVEEIKEVEKQEEPKQEDAPQKEEKKEKIKIEDIDKKIDEILNKTEI